MKFENDLKTIEDPEKAKNLSEKRKEILEAKQQLVIRSLYGITCSNDANPYEDFLRAFVGPEAYILFTFDKTLNSANKQIQTLAADESNSKALKLQPDLSAFPEPQYHESYIQSLYS